MGKYYSSLNLLNDVKIIEMGLGLNSSFIIPVSGDYLVYAPLVGITALINRTAVMELKEQIQLVLENKGTPRSRLFELAHDILKRPVQLPIKRTGKLNPEFLGIIPTRSCNGACKYCDFGADKAPKEKMSYELAVKSVDWYADLLKLMQKDIMDIHFFGGEPMLARDVIEVVVQRARLIAIEKNMLPYFEISTNGQYSAKDASYLGHYFSKVVLSFDGFKDVQNKHRPLKANKSSFENVVETAKIISNSNAGLCIRCCVSSENIMRMEEFTRWLCENFRLSAINFEILTGSSSSVSMGLHPPDPIDFAVHFEKAREIADGYGIEVVYASDIKGCPVVSSCPVGKDTAIISPDGRISNCYLQPEKWQKVSLNLDYGFFTSNGEVQINEDNVYAIRQMVENKPRCRNCFCQWSCAGGCHVGNTYPGSGIDFDNFCIQTRLISAFTLLFNLGSMEKIKGLLKSPKDILLLVNQKSDSLDDFLK